jgi:hypothetical protein
VSNLVFVRLGASTLAPDEDELLNFFVHVVCLSLSEKETFAVVDKSVIAVVGFKVDPSAASPLLVVEVVSFSDLIIGLLDPTART